MKILLFPLLDHCLTPRIHLFEVALVLLKSLTTDNVGGCYINKPIINFAEFRDEL